MLKTIERELGTDWEYLKNDPILLEETMKKILKEVPLRDMLKADQTEDEMIRVVKEKFMKEGWDGNMAISFTTLESNSESTLLFRTGEEYKPIVFLYYF